MSYMTQKIQHTLKATIIALITLVIFAGTAEHARAADLKAQVRALVDHVTRLTFDLRTQAGEPDVTPLPEHELLSIMEAGVGWLQNAQEREGANVGHFRYEYAPFEDSYIDDDNIVRQAGTFYQMAEIARAEIAELPDTEEDLLDSIRYFESLSEEGEHGNRSFSCITSKAGSSECKLGATSLALVGLLDVIETYPEHEDRYEDLAAAWLDFILVTKKEEGGFRDRHMLGRSVQPPRESSFANGEAMLALARYYTFDPQPEIKALLHELFLYIDSDAVPFDSPLYLWAMAALRDMHDLRADDAYIRYAESYTAWRMGGFQTRKLTQYNMCAYVEGIALAHALLRDTDTSTDLDALQNEIDFWLNRSADLQIDKDETYRVLVDESGGVELAQVKNNERARGGFLTSYETPTQRIDYTQHCLNAYLLRYLETKRAEGA